jgi:hypothetical protein
MERVWLPYVSWACGQNNILQLNAVIRQTINKVEVEVRKELWEVTLQDADHSKGSVVEGLDGWGHVFTRCHVGL